VTLRCAGCGTTVPSDAGPWPWSCPNRRPGDDIDHLMVPVPATTGSALVDENDNPFVRYRRQLSSYQVWRNAGRDDDSFVALVDDLDSRIAKVAGHGFVVTPVRQFSVLDEAVGARVWVKDETANVGGSHKGRQLFGVLLLLEVLEELGRMPRRDLAIASCGNAALAAGVLAAAAGRRLTAYVPIEADSSVITELRDLGVDVEACARDRDAGDPCYRRFRAAVADGDVPFSCQGPDNGAVLEGAATLAWELVEAVPGSLDRVVVQVGGGALASGLARGFEARAVTPVFDTVQTSGAHPLERALDRLRETMAAGASVGEAMAAAAAHRSRYMWPWEATPVSVARGILDDETYDWLALARAMLTTGGTAVVADEAILVEANHLARSVTGIDVDETGSAGLAGLLWLARAGRIPRDSNVAVLFTGTGPVLG
jgi:threonine dehydratase